MPSYISPTILYQQTAGDTTATTMPDIAKVFPQTFFRLRAIRIKAAMPNIMGTKGKTTQRSSNIKYTLRI